MLDSVIKFVDVKKIFVSKDIGAIKKTPVLRGLSFSVNENEIVGLIGLNGQGKSTTIKIILGLLYPDSGIVKVFEKYPMFHQIKRNISYLPENPRFFANLDAIEFLSFVGKLRELSGRALFDSIEKILEVVGLWNYRNKNIKKYSKGMLQRLGLAQAFLGSPELVILDEPLSGLDPLGRRMAKDLIISHRENGGTVLFTSHILEDIEHIADRVLILHEGKIVGEVSKEYIQNTTLESIFIQTINNVVNN